MTGRRSLDRVPADYLRAGTADSWPDGELDDDAPTAVPVVRELVLRLRREMGSRSARQVAKEADIGHTTLAALLRGERWPDAATVAKLEAALDADLWPGRLDGP